MLVMSEQSKAFLREHFENAEEMIAFEKVNDVLDVLYDWIDEYGFRDDQEGYNDLGREAQKVYEELYYNNP